MKIILKVLLCFLFPIASVCSIFAATTNENCAMSSDSEIGNLRYEPDGDCDTHMSICCNNLKWSKWGSSCEGADNCNPRHYECWNGSKCESVQGLGLCPQLGRAATWISGTCVEGKGWQYTCRCNATGEVLVYGNNDILQKCKRSCESSTHFENLGSIAMGNVCTGGTGYFFGQREPLTAYAACQKAANNWWRGVSKYMNESEIPDNSCRYNGDNSGGLGGYILSKSPSPDSLGGPQTSINCSNTGSYYESVYCLAFASKTCCDAVR